MQQGEQPKIEHQEDYVQSNFELDGYISWNRISYHLKYIESSFIVRKSRGETKIVHF